MHALIDSILGIIIANLFLISFKKKIQNVDYIIFCLLIIHITSMKFSGVIVLLGISIIFITISVLSKVHKKIIFVFLFSSNCLFMELIFSITGFNWARDS